jgi:5-methyltetrahydrofolate--homocysteine methyltransferase
VVPATSNVDRTVPAPTPPFWGTRILEGIDLERVFRFLALRSLFRLQWGAKSVKGDDWVRLLQDDFMPRLRAMQREALATGWLQPRATYGYYPAAAEGNDVLVFDPDDPGRVLQRFHFPRQPAEERLCIADYFLPVDGERRDVVAFQAVTMGARATQLVDELQAAGEYSDAYYLHGLGVETAEALAEYMHRHINKELRIPRTRGKRYSWGYPACPDLEDHAKVFALLPQAREIGLSLTEAYQLVPEQSTVAIIAHHPQAKYFAARSSPRSTVAG